MIGTIDIAVNAQHPNVPLSPVFAWRGSASRINVEGVPCLCGSWYVSAVSIAIATPDGKTVAYPCQRTSNGIWSATIEATDAPGKSGNGITITAKDEACKDYVLGRGDLYILDGAAIPAPGDVSWTVRLLSSKPEDPKEGDAYFDEDGTLMVYSGGSWRNTMPSATVPTKVSAFENDAGYITEKQVKPGSTPGWAANADHSVSAQSAVDSETVPWTGVKFRPTTLAGYGITDAATKTSQLENDSGYITKADGPVLLVEDINGDKTAGTIGIRTVDGPVGAYTFAGGLNVTAGGYAAHAEGYLTSAAGTYAHAEGTGATATGTSAHAEGNGTSASGNFSHAEGFSTTAAGNGSHAEGFKAQTKTDDDYAYSWNGDETRTEPYSSHGKGTFNVNPVGGSDGFYVGEKKLTEVISDGVANKADKATTLAGYGITNAATKTELTSATADKLTAADVVPKGSGTETIATIAGKDIKAPAGGGGGIGYMFVQPVPAGGDSGVKLMLGDVYLYGYGYYGSGGTSLTQIPICRTVDNVQISTLYCTPGETLVLPCAADDARNGTAIDFPVGSCLEVSTAIAMADGTTKRVADVKVGDKVLSIDPLTGEKTVDTVTETAHGWKDRRDIWTFGDGTTVTTVGRHRFYDVDLGEFLYLEAWEPGEGARAADGCKVRLVGHERVEGRTEYATIWTEQYNNYFAGGLLAGNRRSITGAGL